MHHTPPAALQYWTVSVLSSSAGAPGKGAAVLTVDTSGRACLWQEPLGALLRAAQLSVRPTAGGALLLPGGHHAAVPCRYTRLEFRSWLCKLVYRIALSACASLPAAFQHT